VSDLSHRYIDNFRLFKVYMISTTLLYMAYGVWKWLIALLLTYFIVFFYRFLGNIGTESESVVQYTKSAW